jgi:hypothetical protein
MITMTDLINRWRTNEGKPYKGRLIDVDAYNKNPNDIGCMCAQGQVLHLIGGWSPRQLVDTTLSEADKETAKLLNFSRAHSVLLRIINDRPDGEPADVITNPRAVLGENWSSVLDFWHYIDNMGIDKLVAAGNAALKAAGNAASEAAAAAVGKAARADAGVAALNAAGTAVWEAAGTAVWEAAGTAVWEAAGEAARAAARTAPETASWLAARAAAGATAEIQGASILRERGESFAFLPAFAFASPDDIPPRRADYGIVF